MPTPINFKKRALVMAVHTACGAMIGLSPLAHADPQGGVVVGGTGSISQTGTTTTIHQQSQNMAINWQSYNLNANEHVQYIQPNSNAISLNRILSNNGSTIAGRIDANGRVILVNPNGIFFTPTASLNVGSLIASGLDINPDDFMNGHLAFHAIDGTNGTVVNQGIINASTGGNAALTGKQVRNDGVIVANLGTVTLAAGKEAILTFDNEGLLGVKVTQAILQEELGVDPAVLNNGTIQAQGGKVLLTASQSQDLFSQAVNTTGLEQATSVVVHPDGSFTLGDGADVQNTGSIDTSTTSQTQGVGRIVLIGQNVTSSGTINANAKEGNAGEIELHAQDMTLLTDNSLTTARAENGQGGTIKVLGDKVGVFNQSTIDVSGSHGGGKALIGGDFQGKNSNIRNATRTYVGQGAAIYADAIDHGNGGQVIAWSDNAAWFYGKASARGGMQGGDGGLVEVSGKRYLEFKGAVDTTAPMGRIGTLLLDPTDITILDGQADTNPDGDTSDSSFNGCPTITGSTCNSPLYGTILGSYAGPSTLYETELEGISSATNVVLEATNDITLNPLGTLVLQLTSGSIRFTADSDGNGVGSFSMNAADTISTQGGSVTIEGADVTVGNINTTGIGGRAGGAITLTATTGNLSAAALTSNGGVAASGQNGHAAGNITVAATSGAVSITGAIFANGSNAHSSSNGPGGNAGAISIAGNTVTAGGNVMSNGGAGDNGVQGSGGNITFTGPVTLGSSATTIDASGGTSGNIIFNDSVNVSASSLSVAGRNVSFVGAITASSLTVDAARDLSISGNLTTTGATVLNFGTATAGTFTANSGITVTTGTGVLTINGGSGADTFRLGTSIAGAVNGNDGNDTFNITAAGLSFSDLNGGNGNDTLSGFDQTNDWQITGDASGTLNTNIVFRGMQNLAGGGGSDTFVFGAAGTLGGQGGWVDGNGGADTVNLAGAASPNVILGDGVYRDIETFIGNGTTSSGPIHNSVCKAVKHRYVIKLV